MDTVQSTLDFSELRCPIPVLRLKKALAKAVQGSSLLVVGLSPESKKDLVKFCESRGPSLSVDFPPDETSLQVTVQELASC